MTNAGAATRLDCLVVGGGPAGLTAALYLARFNRTFVVIDAGQSRAQWIPTSHNIPMFADGLGGRDLLEAQREHLVRYGVRPLPGTVTSLEKVSETFVARAELGSGEHTRFESRTVLLATGSVDIEPRLPDLPNAIQKGLVRYCPICDGYEAQGKRIAVIGYGDQGIGEAIFVARTYSGSVTLLTLGEPMDLTPDQQAGLDRYSIKVVHEPVAALQMGDGRIAAMRVGGGELSFEVLYSALGLQRRSSLGRKLGARHDESEALLTDEHGETSIRGLYAAGGVVRGLDQIVVAMGQGAIAASGIHNRCSLPTEEEAGG